MCHVQVRASVSSKKKSCSQRQGFYGMFSAEREGSMKSITSSDGESFAMIIEDPIPLEHGKGAWPCFEGGCTFFSLVATASCQIRVYPSHFFDGRCRARLSGCSSSDPNCCTTTKHKVMSQRCRTSTIFWSDFSVLTAAHTTYRSH